MKHNLTVWMSMILTFVLFLLHGLSAEEIGRDVGTFKQETSIFYSNNDTLPAEKIRFIDGTFLKNDSLKMKELELVQNTKEFLSAAFLPNEIRYIGKKDGLYKQENDGDLQPLYPRDNRGRRWAPTNVRALAGDGQGRLWFGCTQGVGCLDGEAWTLYTGQDGLPYNDFTCLAAGGDGSIWFGTTKGAIRFDGQTWSYRQGRRWLPHDHVNDIHVTKEGHAWIATKNGIAHIERKPLTLREKAAFYEHEIEQYIKRTEYGYVSEVRLKNPGDKSEIIKTDSDNDGLWTGMYGAGECFAYAATGDPQAKQRAKQAFEALRFLSVVTQGGEVEQQPGFLARTVIPTTEPDPNQWYTIERMKQKRQENDALWKIIHPRWPLGKDEKYWYKIDTSSDELDGHFFFYPLYYDLVADTPKEKERVREVVRAIADHFLRNDFCLIDHDGKPTRWAIFRPSILNFDPIWYPERGLNSLSMLSYLTVAEHITGEPKYGKAVKQLIEKHGYAQNLMVPKIQRGLGSGNQSDDEMAFMCFYNLIKYTKDKNLKKQFTFAFYNYWILEFPEMNPFFNFAYAVCGLGLNYEDPWDDFSLAPWDGWLDDSIQTLKDLPLDRVNWAHQNSHRIDIQHLPNENRLEPPYNTQGLGYRANGKCLPVNERHFNHWNHNPWRLDTGGNGTTLSSGAVYLLPYYMGLYHGFIE
ncbi:hypothetical protein GF373_05840 [bacterium]|nr:hypothetical protein [bacterium]